MRKIAFITACVLCAFTTWAQQRTVTGIVTDHQNAPVAGATVSVKGASAGTQTDSSGSFRLSVSNDAKALVISFVGLASQEVSIEGRDRVSVALKTTPNNMNEVVVVGYTSQRKQDLTGAVAVVDLTPVKNNSSGNTMQALQGRVAG